MLKQRVITAMVLLGLLVLVLNTSPLVFSLAVWGIGILAANEFLLLFAEFKERKWRWSVLSFLLLNLIVNGLMPLKPLLFLNAIWWILVVPMLIWQYSKWQRVVFSWGMILGMLFLIFIPAISSINRIVHDYGAISLLYFWSGIWINDAGAYLVGRKYGELPLAAKISPNKTKEGFWGGLFLSVLWSILWGLVLAFVRFKPLIFLREPKKFLMVFFLSILTSLLGTLGDLFESMLKRNAGVKDSGHMLPGHGGWLDRIDSTLAVMPIWMLGLILMN